jgi:flagellar hook-associated protein FlgK
MNGFSIGVSALATSQKLLDLTGQNIANAGTPGYHRQVATLAPLDVGDPQGAGVIVTGVTRQRNDLLETALLNNTYESQDVSAQLDNMRQVQAYLAPGSGSLDTQISNFFNQVQQLAATPTDAAQRQVVLNTASSLATTLNTNVDQLRQLSATLDTTGANLVDNINNYAQQVADLNGQIQRATALHQQPNELLDQRDQLISKLSELVDVRVIPTNFNEVNVLAAGAPIVAGTQALKLQYSVGSDNKAVLVRADQASQGLNVTGGQAAGLLQVRNGDLPDLRGRLDTLSQALVQGVDEAQATGLGLTGPLTSSAGTRAVSDPTANLDAAGLAFPPTAGDLFVSVTDPSGARTLHKISIDPTGKTAGTVHSLNDLRDALNAIQVGSASPLQASVTPNNTLQITAANGYSFDFAGRLPSSPTSAVGVNGPGQVSAQVSGSYTGTSNDTYHYTITGPNGGTPPYTVGTTAGLSLNVYDGSGTLLNTFNIGQGYTPGAALPAVNGVTASIGSGTVQGTESFQAPVTANPDTGNVLTALGVNTLFTGSSASTIGVRPDLLLHPELLSGSRNGDTGDGSNFTKIAAVQDARTLANGTQTIGQYFASVVGDVGVRVQDLSNQQTAQQALGQQLSAQQQAVSGVDPNEELTNLLQYQRSFQMASEYINVINQTLGTLLGILPINTSG